jgi:hypothetical protein
VPSRSLEESHLYRVSFQFYARDQVEALKIIDGALQCAPKITMKIENLDRRRMQIQVLIWGTIIGLFFGAFALWCIAEGAWTR